jgi:hypothetical protein
MQQKRSKTRSPKVAQTGHWRTLLAALDELGWPWLRLHDELVAKRAFYRTHPAGYEIPWEAISNKNRTLNLADSEVTFNGRAPGAVELRAHTVAVEVFLPVGQHPPAASIKASWRDRVPEADLKIAMEEIAKSYDGKPRPPFNDVWSKLKDRFGPDFPRDPARGALTTYAPQLKRALGETSKVKSRS